MYSYSISYLCTQLYVYISSSLSANYNLNMLTCHPNYNNIIMLHDDLFDNL